MDNSIGSKVIRGTVIIVFVGVLAKITAFITEATNAAYLGTTYQSDAYYMVVSIQQVVYPMLSVGIWKVFLPIYKEYITYNKMLEASQLTNKVITLFTVVSGIAVLTLVFFAEYIVSFMAPGFRGETRKLCIELVRISAPMYVFIIASSVYAAILQCHNKFLGSQIREIITHLPTIFAIFFLFPHFGIQILAVALVLGGVLRLLIELPFVDWGYKFRPDFNFKAKEFIVIVRRFPSALISEGAIQLNMLVDKAMASTLSEGTISGLNYGSRLMHVFSGLLSTAVTTALYPQMIELIALEKVEELNKLIIKIINIFCVLMIPITFACILFRNEIVSVAFKRGNFGISSVLLTSEIFALYSIGVFFVACNAVITNLFYSFENTKTPMYISVANLLINIGLNLIFIYFWGVNGLAFATSMSAIITFFIRIKAAKKYLNFEKKNMLMIALKIMVISAISCGIPRLIFYNCSINTVTILILSAIMGIMMYIFGLKILSVTELNDIISIIIKRYRK